jgi:hypothetical protein
MPVDAGGAARIARRLGRTPAQVLLRWCLEREIPVIAKSTHQLWYVDDDGSRHQIQGGWGPQLADMIGVKAAKAAETKEFEGIVGRYIAERKRSAFPPRKAPPTSPPAITRRARRSREGRPVTGPGGRR